MGIKFADVSDGLAADPKVLRSGWAQILGYMASAGITGKQPGCWSPSMGIKFADVPDGFAADSKVLSAGWAQILVYMAFCGDHRQAARLLVSIHGHQVCGCARLLVGLLRGA